MIYTLVGYCIIHTVTDIKLQIGRANIMTNHVLDHIILKNDLPY